jgi:hypothetical protein
VLSVGHPVTFLRTLEQREKSWYMLLFNFPGPAERWLTGQDWPASGPGPGILTATR